MYITYDTHMHEKLHSQFAPLTRTPHAENHAETIHRNKQKNTHTYTHRERQRAQTHTLEHTHTHTHTHIGVTASSGILSPPSTSVISAP